MKSRRISSKDYEELLKLMRMWPEPYRSKIAPLIWHVSWGFNEITRLKERLDKLEQPELLNEEQKLLQAFPGSRVIKPGEPMPKTKVEKVAKVYTTPAERIKYVFDTYGIDSKEWLTMLRLKGLTNADAMKLLDSIPAS